MDDQTLKPNREIAEQLRQAADLLERQGANPFRVQAYRRAADTVARLPENVRDLVDQQGIDGLLALPGIGQGIAKAVHELVMTGRWGRLERLRGALDPVRLFQIVPGLGPQLAQLIHDTLRVDNLEALEAAAHDGRLEAVPGFGPRRAAAVRATLASLLGRSRFIRQRPATDGPGVDLVLDVDREYREQAAAGQLPVIAPKRFNPDARAWLPILHTQRGDWHFTALYSNTARAHELDRTHDWVVVYGYDDHHQEIQYTVVTETRGPLRGQRVIRGREAACRAFHERRESPA
ncbi:MAG: helix-hairpin-helix domain-containing protein [Candidatus Competibacteraceae bacterium]